MNLQDTNAIRHKFATEHGIHFAYDEMVIIDKPEYFRDSRLAFDAQPILQTPQNAGIPAFLTTAIYPEAINIVTAPNKATEMLAERMVGDYTQKVLILSNVEDTGTVSAYSDFSGNGAANSNASFDNYQAFRFQSVINYGDEEVAIGNLAKLNVVSNKQRAAASAISKFQNLSYFRGIAGLQCYGLLNTPGVSAAIAPAPKAWGGVGWMDNNVVRATALEIYNDLLSLVNRLIDQGGGNISADSRFTLGMSPKMNGALRQISQFNINVIKSISDNYPNLKIVDAVQYGALSANNTQGNAGGEVLQLICHDIEGQDTGFCGFTSKLMAGRVVAQSSSFEQKFSAATGGAMIRRPFAVATMIGV